MAHMNDRKYNASLSYGSASMVLGVGAAITTVMMTGIFPLILAPLAMIFGILSKGAEKKLTGSGRHGFLLAAGALAADLVLLSFSAHSLMTDADAHSTLNRMSVNLYGISFDDTMESLEKELGISIPGFRTEEELRGTSGRPAGENPEVPDSSPENPGSAGDDTDSTEENPFGEALPYTGLNYT